MENGSLQRRFKAWCWYYLYDRLHPKPLKCLFLGHRGLKKIPHRELCETPWDAHHLEAVGDELEIFCTYCDWYKD